MILLQVFDLIGKLFRQICSDKNAPFLPVPVLIGIIDRQLPHHGH
jgi:hypothetical protein